MFLLWQMRSRLAFCSSGMWVRRRLRVTKALMMRRISAKVGQGLFLLFLYLPALGNSIRNSFYAG